MRRLLDNVTLVDGSGVPPRPARVLIEEETIAEIDDITLGPDEVWDLDGAVLAPGFIDIHSHSDFTLPGMPEARAKVQQGVTTEVVCNCGLGLFPATDRVRTFYDFVQPILFGEREGTCFDDLEHFRDALHGRGVSVNVAALVPHSNVRCAVMGLEEREARDGEVERMGQLVAEVMEQGAFGMSTGLVYPPGAFADRQEITELCSVVREHGGFYATHMRDEGAALLESVEEAIGIGRDAGVPVQLSHHKAAGRLNWGKTKRSLALVDRARAEGLDVTSDVYPYTAGSTLLSAMFLPLWAFEGSLAQLLERLADGPTRARIVEDSKERLLTFAKLPGVLDRVFPKRLLLPLLLRELGKVVVISSTKRQHHYEGMNLHEMARSRGQTLYEAMLDLLLEEETAVAAIAHVMDERDVTRVMLHPHTMIGTDGFPQREGKPHPRTFGTYPRVLEHYVRERGELTLESAVHKMTGMVANRLGLRERGYVRVGARADLVVFEPDAIRDRASYEDPRNSPSGLSHVFVNGAPTVRDGEHTGARAGRVLRRG